MYDFDNVVSRIGTGSIKWNKQRSFGVPNGLLPFWIADTDFCSVPEVMEALKKRCEHPMIGYSDVELSCLQAISGWYSRRHNWSIRPEQLLPSAGVVTSLRFSIQALSQPGDKVLIFTPVYDPFFEIIHNSDRTLVDCPLIHHDDTYDMDFALLEEELKAGVKIVILCNPHNPLGRVWSYEDLERLAGLCKQYDAYILSDEIHGDITLYNNKYTTMGRFEQIHDRLVVYTAVSKTFNLAGLVSSCMLIPCPQMKKRIDDALSAAWIFGPNALAFAAIEAAYTNGDKWVDEQNAYLTESAELVKAFMKANMPEIKVNKQEGTFLMWLDMTCMHMSSDDITTMLASKYNIAVSNGAHYGKQADGFMRFNIGCPHSTLEKGLDLMLQFYKEEK